MHIIGHKLLKVVGERGEPKGPISIKNNLEVTDLVKKDFFAAGEKKEGLNFKFLYEVDYGKSVGNIKIEGLIFVVDEPQELKKMEKKWKKNKKVDPALAAPVLNRAMDLSIVQSVPLANSLGLPSPIRIPRIVPAEEGKE